MKNKIITLEDESYDALRNLIRRRRKRRFQMIVIFQHSLRLLMLVKSLRLPGANHLDPIFICLCGLISQIISIFKATQEKQKLIKLEESDKKDIGTRIPYTKSLSLSNPSMACIEE